MVTNHTIHSAWRLQSAEGSRSNWDCRRACQMVEAWAAHGQTDHLRVMSHDAGNSFKAEERGSHRLLGIESDVPIGREQLCHFLVSLITKSKLILLLTSVPGELNGKTYRSPYQALARFALGTRSNCLLLKISL